MANHSRLGLALALIWLGVGCVESGSVPCGNLLCGRDRICSPAGNACVLQSQLVDCQGREPGAPCTYDGIAGVCTDGVCVDANCGNGVVEPGEACDDENRADGDGCSSDCKSDETCGNGVVDSQLGEFCDTGAANSDAPNATCRTDCKGARCGDGILDALSGEACDGTIGSETCDDFGFYGGVLACGSACQFDTSGCDGRCGDGVKDDGEVCDGADLGGQTCLDLDFYEADGLACNNACLFDTSECVGFCGDDMLNGNEDCDGSTLPSGDCVAIGFDYGHLGCRSNTCTADAAACGLFGWQTVFSATAAGIRGLWAAGPNEIYAVGSGGVIVKSTGSSSVLMNSGTPQILQGIWGADGNNIFAVGFGGAIVRYNGSSWSTMTSGTTQIFTDVWGTSANDVFAVGFVGSPGTELEFAL